MSTLSKNKLLPAAVIILLLTNIAMLVFFFCCKGPGPKGPRNGNGREAMMKEFLQKEIGFTTQQIELYDTLSKQHKIQMKASFEEMKNNKELQFKELGRNAFSDSAIILTASKATEMQKGMEVKMISHFKDIRKLCTPEQLPKFDSLFYKIWSKKKEDKKKSE